MEFSADQMRNVMVSFRDVALSPVAVNKFFHAVTSGWCLAGAFVVGVSGWFLIRKRHVAFAVRSIKVGGAVGLAGILLCMYSGDGSAVEVTKVQPMKLAAMEGLYEGKEGPPLVGFGILNPDKQWNDTQEPMLFEIAIPKGLSILGRHDADAFIPGIKDIIEGKDVVDGKMVNTVPYAERISRGKAARKALAAYNEAKKTGNAAGMAAAEKALKPHYKYFGYGYFNDVKEAIPNVAMVFYPFHIMVAVGGWLLVFLAATVYLSFRRREWLSYRWKSISLFPVLALLTLPLTYICSQCGWIVAEVGRQPWAIQDIMPVQAAVSSLSVGQVVTTFIIFGLLFTVLLCAEINIMIKQIKKGPEAVDGRTEIVEPQNI